MYVVTIECKHICESDFKEPIHTWFEKDKWNGQLLFIKYKSGEIYIYILTDPGGFNYICLIKTM